LNGGYALPPVPDPTNVQAILANYIGGTPAQKPAEFAQASPIAHVRSGLPPTLLIGGARDELVRLAFQHAMRDRLHLQHDVVVSIDLPWSNHSFDEIPNGLGGQIARYYTERFFAATL
jgi:acetyl esterase/lipase